MHSNQNLTGTKVDLREDEQVLARLKEQQKSPITYEQGAELAKSLGCYSYRECSAKQLKGQTEVFDDAIRVVIAAENKQQKKKGRCALC